MNFKIAHTNFNVVNMQRSIDFYKEALGMELQRRRTAPDGSYELAFLNDAGGSGHQIELTWLADHPQPYDLSDNEIHLAFVVDDYEAARQKHGDMGCICFDNTAMGLYFINDPDGYWIEILPRNRA